MSFPRGLLPASVSFFLFKRRRSRFVIAVVAFWFSFLLFALKLVVLAELHSITWDSGTRVYISWSSTDVWRQSCEANAWILCR